MKAWFSILTILALMLYGNAPLQAYDHRAAHRGINELAASKSKLDETLKNRLGILKGLEAELHEKSIIEWLSEGGEREDDGLRFMNHFHDPLKPWESAGLLWGNSSLIWAQLCEGCGSTPNYNSWAKARQDYYLALTGGSEYNFSSMFRSLGQIMHLLADAAAPAHVRNDSHPVGEPYEEWVRTNWQMVGASAAGAAVTIDPSVFGRRVSNSSAPAPISALWDQDNYNLGDPMPAPSSQVGLAEYTNANFFSEGTIFKDYPHPSMLDTDIMSRMTLQNPEIIVNGPYIDNRVFIYANVGKTRPLAAITYLWVDCADLGYMELAPVTTSEEIVHESYSSELVPLAIGYNAALLDYFFRGAIEITPPQSGGYALYDTREHSGESLSDAGFTEVRLRARNVTPNEEEMNDGKIELVVKYKESIEDPFVPRPISSSSVFSYYVAPEKNNTRSLPRGGFVELTFDFPQGIPIYSTDVYFYLIYRGTLGKGEIMEQDAVAVGFKDVSEPTPFDLVNTMDKIWLNTAWYNAGSEANQVVDYHTWDIYPHGMEDLYIRFTPAAAPQAPNPQDPQQFDPHDIHIPDLAAGEYVRVYFLTDKEYGYGFSPFRATGAPVEGLPPDNWSHQLTSPFTGALNSVKRQTEWVNDAALCGMLGLAPPCDFPYYPAFNCFQGRYDWSRQVIMNKPYPNGSQVSWTPLETCPQGN